MTPFGAGAIINLDTKERVGRGDWVWASSLAVIYALILCVLGDARGFWLDEYKTMWAAQLDWAGMVRERFGEGHSPLYFAYAKLFWLIPGADERI